MLVLVRRARKISTAPVIQMHELSQVERALDGSIPNDLLGFWVGTGRSVSELVYLTDLVCAFYEGVEERGWRRRFKFDHVAFDDDYNPDEGPLCSPLGVDRPATIVFWFLRKADQWQPTFCVKGEPAFVSYCRWKYSSPEATPDPVEFGASVDPMELTAFQPRIVGSLVRQVVHPKFGRGRVVGQEGSGDDAKLEIDFDGVRRKIQARFVRDA
jgi:hypothetical protein